MKLRTRWYKVISDLWNNRGRTLIVALAVAVGIYAVGSVEATQTILEREFAADQATANPASAILITEPFLDDLPQRIAEIPGVAAAEGRHTITVRAITGPDSWRDMDLIVISDFTEMRVGIYPYVAGEWPTAKDEMMLEWLGSDYIGTEIGDTMTIELSNGTRKELTVTGTAHNPQVPAPSVFNRTYGFISQETARTLGYSGAFSELHVLVEGEESGETAVRAVIDDVTDQVNKSGRLVLNTTIVGEQFTQTLFDTVNLMLTTFSWLILFFSGFLVVNTISALLTQQVQQIGVMKLIGAGRLQIAGMYLLLVEVYGIIAFLISFPLTVVTPRLLMRFVLEPLMNLRSDSYAIPTWIFLVMAAIGILIPLVAGLLPVRGAIRMTTQQALSETGMSGSGGGSGLVEQLISRLPQKWMQRPFRLALRNTLRHKGRLLRTLLVLIIGTTLFVAVLSVNISLTSTQADFAAYHQYDLAVQFAQPHRTAELEHLALSLPEVTAVESWNVDNAVRMRPDGSESNRYIVYGLPEETKLVAPVMQEGRWLQPEDIYAVVINVNVHDQEPDIQVGEAITLNLNGREQEWEVVGIAGTDAQGPNIYMNAATYRYETRTTGQANRLQLITNQHDSSFQQEMAVELFDYFSAQGYTVTGTITADEISNRGGTMFTIITAFLIFMAVLLAAVGSLGLSTTMSINMFERIREIGVLRAIGASNTSIRGIVLLEGMFIGALSWIFGVILSYPTAIFISDAIGYSLLNMPLTFEYNIPGAIAWLFAILGLAIAASLGPARNASRLTIREVLAYE